MTRIKLKDAPQKATGNVTGAGGVSNLKPQHQRLNCSSSLGELYELTFEDALKFAKFTMRKYLPVGASAVSAEDFVSKANIKIIGAEQALKLGHAVILNRRIQLRPEIASQPDMVSKYSEGLRHWDRSKHTFESFLHLVIASDVRNCARKFRDHYSSEKNDFNVGGVSLIKGKEFGGEEPDPEKEAGVRMAKSDLIEALDVSELKQIATLILNSKYDIMDIAFELGLTKSQVEKRVRKIEYVAANLCGEL